MSRQRGRPPQTPRAEFSRERLRERLLAADLSANALDEALKVGWGLRVRTSDYLHGRCMPSLPAFYAISKVLGCRMEDLMQPIQEDAA